MADYRSTTGRLTNVMQTYYDKVMLERLTPQLRFHQFGDKKPLPKDSGKSILWNRFTNFGEGSTLTEGTKPDAKSMSATSISATLTQKGDLVSMSDLLGMTAICDVIKTATELMADAASLTVDGYIESRFQYAKTASGIQGQAAHPAFDVFVNNAGTWGISAGGSVCIISHALMRKQKLTVSAIRPMVTKLRVWNAPTFPDGYYVGIVHPTASQGLRADKEFQNWNQYTNPEAMYKGEIGKVEGVRFVETTHIDTIGAKSAAGSSLGTIIPSYIFGPHAYGVTDFDGAKKIFVIPATSGDKADPLEQWSYVGYKITMAAKVLNDSCGLIALTSTS